MCLHHTERGKQTALLKAQKVSFPFSGMHRLLKKIGLKEVKKRSSALPKVLQFPPAEEIKCSKSCAVLQQTIQWMFTHITGLKMSTARDLVQGGA